jgi:hypothetical protein
MSTLSAYLPQDRMHALAHGRALPDRGWARPCSRTSPVSRAWPNPCCKVFGPRRGAEELGVHLNRVYDALIAEVERYGGSVVTFAGDAITCWFDSSVRAVACALAMQAVMRAFAGLSLKVAVTHGPARRFVVGDPQIQLLDALAGATLARVAQVERLAQPGDVFSSMRR